MEESIIRQIQMFHLNLCRDELKDTEIYRRFKRTTRILPSLEQLEATGVPVYKIFLFSTDIEMLDRIRTNLETNRGIAVASSFETNLEITDVKAQKGPVLKEYIESLGYSMDEVMALGDSLNDLSMIPWTSAPQSPWRMRCRRSAARQNISQSQTKSWELHMRSGNC